MRDTTVPGPPHEFKIYNFPFNNKPGSSPYTKEVNSPMKQSLNWTSELKVFTIVESITRLPLHTKRDVYHVAVSKLSGLL